MKQANVIMTDETYSIIKEYSDKKKIKMLRLYSEALEEGAKKFLKILKNSLSGGKDM